MKQRPAVDVDDRDVVDESPVAGIGLKQIVQGDVGLHVIGQGPPHRDRIAGVDRSAAEVGYGVRGGVGQLMRQADCRILGIGDAQPQNLGDVQIPRTP